MTRTEEAKKHLRDKYDAEAITTQAVIDISITLAMLYDLMKEKETDNDSSTD